MLKLNFPRHGVAHSILLAGFALTTHGAPLGTMSARLAVDQFGYMADMEKIAVLSDPQSGFNMAESYTPGAALQVRDEITNNVIYSGAPVAWNGGATHAQSGDKLWWFDFSSVRKWGGYYLHDPATNLRSAVFRIDHRVYGEVLKQAMRVFFYQRRGFAKQPPYTDAKWADAASHLRSNQDPRCRLVTDQGNAATEKDLRGGWFDAGDYNKYTNFTFGPLSNLLFAYEANPLVWGDDFNLPESGNGVPDLLDEMRWELDWLLRMQNGDGSVLSKVSSLGFNSASPPSSDVSPIYYGAASASATFSAAATFAHASRVYGKAGQTAFAAQLATAAVNAWTWAVAHPASTYNNAGFSSANPEVSSYTRDMHRLCAAIYLYALASDSAITGGATYRTYVENNYTSAHPIMWGYWYAYEAPVQDALLYYTTLPGIGTGIATAIRNSKQGSMGGSEFLPAFTGKTDGYRAYLKNDDYIWGSNQNKSHAGILFLQQNVHGIDPANASVYRNAAGGYLHYMHGVNPLGMTYLTNMYAFGGDSCANEMYHAWFGDGTAWDNARTSPKGPAPGYLTGGANPTWKPDAAYAGPAITPPSGQPVQKSYKDWNTSYPENSWELTEPAIYYQAAYVNLLSKLIRPLTYSDWQSGHGLPETAADLLTDGDKDGLPNLI
ncbi:MAG: glycoside hydrolase family 9 protein, partial [Verrucomicrobiota bacterium]